MNITKTSAVLGVIVSALVGVIVGYVAHTQVQAPVQSIVGSSPAGTTFSTPKTAMIVFSPTAPGATSTSILNSDSNDRVIRNVAYACTGLGTSLSVNTGSGLASGGLVFTGATTSSANPSVITNTNYVFNSSIPTTTAALAYEASTTPGLTGTVTNRIWPSGSYLSYTSNATNTAVCTIENDYVPE